MRHFIFNVYYQYVVCVRGGGSHEMSINYRSVSGAEQAYSVTLGGASVPMSECQKPWCNTWLSLDDSKSILWLYECICAHVCQKSWCNTWLSLDVTAHIYIYLQSCTLSQFWTHAALVPSVIFCPEVSQKLLSLPLFFPVLTTAIFSQCLAVLSISWKG